MNDFDDDDVIDDADEEFDGPAAVEDCDDTDAEHDVGDDAESGQPRQDGTQSAPTLWRGHYDRDLRWAVHGRRVGEHPQVEAIR